MDYFEPKIIVIAVCTMVFLAIVLDIVRRRKRNRYENLQMPRDLDRSASPDFDKDPFSESQCPSGGARIVSRDGDHDFSERIENEKQKKQIKKEIVKIEEKKSEDKIKNTQLQKKDVVKKQTRQADKINIEQAILKCKIIETCKIEEIYAVILEINKNKKYPNLTN